MNKSTKRQPKLMVRISSQSPKGYLGFNYKEYLQYLKKNNIKTTFIDYNPDEKIEFK